MEKINSLNPLNYAVIYTKKNSVTSLCHIILLKTYIYIYIYQLKLWNTYIGNYFRE